MAAQEHTGIAASIVSIGKTRVPVRGYLAKPIRGEHLPAVLLVPGLDGLGEPTLRAAREIADRGFVALAVDYDPDHLLGQSELVRTVSEASISIRLNVAVEWLQGQPGVDRRRVGAVGWAEGSSWLLKLARQGLVQAGAVLGGIPCSDVDQLVAGTPPMLLIIGGRSSGCTSQTIAALNQRMATAGLRHELRFVEATTPDSFATANPKTKRAVYDFLIQNVSNPQGLAQKPASNAPDQIASIRDIMRVINSDNGVKGKLARMLAASPSDDEQWEQIRSQAAILAESGNWLLARRPEKGTLVGWRQRAMDFRTKATALLRAVEQHNFPLAQQVLMRLPESCAACHLDHR